ncbi:hypothetical protein PLANPX_3914 [Lacipirellula parvula]|uniref:Uncharacterized protein n=2 Tax=Lacipirellula parvula TaxID=2650471 RepID=A0A5K7XE59_9BACT|nr:hypothetical protein PLANPX_3914 [Lacipirellula parvula]
MVDREKSTQPLKHVLQANENGGCRRCFDEGTAGEDFLLSNADVILSTHLASTLALRLATGMADGKPNAMHAAKGFTIGFACAQI